MSHEAGWFTAEKRQWVVRGMSRKFSISCTSEYPGMKSLPLFFNNISLHLDELSPSLFQFAYPSKTEVLILVLEVLIYCIYDTVTASEIPTTKISFKLWEQTCEQVHYPARAEQLKTTLPHNLLMQLTQFFCIIYTVYSATFLKIINHDYFLIIP